MITLLSEAHFREEMEGTVLPYLNARKSSGYAERVTGEKMLYEHFTCENGKAAVVLVHGFTESIPKFYETAYYLMQLDYSVWLYQQRGHGESFRNVSDPSLVDIKKADDLVEDLHYFTEEIVKKEEAPGMPRFLLAHSMGGAVSACLLETYPEDYDKAVLSSPMLEIDTGSYPPAVARFILKAMKLFGKGEAYMPGGQPFNDTPDFENSCTTCRVRFDYDFERDSKHPSYRMSSATAETSLAFMDLAKRAVNKANCARVTKPVLLFQAGRDNMVLPGGQDLFVSQISHGRKFRMENAKHEILRSVNADLEVFWRETEAFYQEA